MDLYERRNHQRVGASDATGGSIRGTERGDAYRVTCIAWLEVDESPAAVDRAKHLAKTHRLRAMDALQLAAALIACGYKPARLPFVTLDIALASAARAEGFIVLP